MLNSAPHEACSSPLGAVPYDMISDSNSPLASTPSQAAALQHLLQVVLTGNSFYQAKLAAAASLSGGVHLIGLQKLPFTTKSELAADQAAYPPFGSNHSYPLRSYTRFHQTSGSSGAPLRWLDDSASWESMLDCWRAVYQAAGIGPGNRVFFAFSFGPFLGFWTAFEAAAQLGCLCIPGGGISTSARLRMIADTGAEAVCCTPTYAIRMGEAAREEGVDLGSCGVRRIIVAGEPGGSLPEVRARISELWGGAQPFDHHGMTEVGPVTYECPSSPGVLHVIEQAFIAECIDRITGEPLPEGAAGELVLTTLKRLGSPLIRYRTGDLVKFMAGGVCACGSRNLRLDGGILGRCDDMIVVRGVNLYPSAIDAIVRRVPGIAEYCVRVSEERGMAEVSVEIEVARDHMAGTAIDSLTAELRSAFSLRIPVTQALEALPRFEMKSRRWLRNAPTLEPDAG